MNMTLSSQDYKVEEKFPRDLRIGDTFRLRAATNSKKYRVTGIVLKICKENGFKNFHSEDHGKVHIPVDRHNSINELVLKPDHKIYVLSLR